MATLVRNQSDKYTDEIQRALDAYENIYPGSKADLYRQNPGSIRVRIVDDRFSRMSKSDRHDDVWSFLEGKVSHDALSELSVLLLLPKAELASSLANLDFEDPLPSRL